SVTLNTQLRIANVTANPATVHLWIGGQEMISGCTPSSSPFLLAAGASLRISCAGVNNGPVKIQSNQNIVATERVLYSVNNPPTSLTELLALPNSKLSTTYWLPWYNSTALNPQLRIAKATANPATVHLFINGQEKVTGCTPSNSPFTLAAGASLRVTCA